MAKKIALQIDPIELLKFNTDSTIYIAKEFQKRGYSLYYYTTDQLTLTNNSIYANGLEIELLDKPPFFKKKKMLKLNLEKMDFILMRQDPPFDMHYINATYMLDRVKDKVKVINDPTAVRSNVEKLMIYDFPDNILPSIISFDEIELHSFFKKHKKVIVKPLYGHGGKGLELIDSESKFKKIISSLIKNKEHFVMQKFCSAVLTKGDKRVIIINGKVVGVVGKKAADGKIATNIAAGGKASLEKLTAPETTLCRKIGKYLKQKNLFLAGIDIVDGYLLEINITSPTMLKVYHELSGKDLAKMFCDELGIIL